jgi:hypothetical protein
MKARLHASGATMPSCELQLRLPKQYVYNPLETAAFNQFEVFLFDSRLERLQRVRVAINDLGNGWSDHQEVGAELTVLDLADKSELRVKVSSHNIWCPNTPISTKSLEMMGVTLPAFSKEQQGDLKKVSASDPRWIEASEDSSLERIEISGRLHVAHLNKGYQIQVAQEVPKPGSKAFTRFTSAMSTHQKESLEGSYNNSDNSGKFGTAILVSEGISARVCRHINDFQDTLGLELSEEQRCNIQNLFNAIERTRYEKFPHDRRASLCIINSPQGTYGVVALHTDWHKVDATLDLIIATNKLGMIAAGDLNIETLGHAGITDATITQMQSILSTLEGEVDRNESAIESLQIAYKRALSLIRADLELPEFGILKASGNTYDGVFGKNAIPIKQYSSQLERFSLQPGVTEGPKLSTVTLKDPCNDNFFKLTTEEDTTATPEPFTSLDSGPQKQGVR